MTVRLVVWDDVLRVHVDSDEPALVTRLRRSRASGGIGLRVPGFDPAHFARFRYRPLHVAPPGPEPAPLEELRTGSRAGASRRRSPRRSSRTVAGFRRGSWPTSTGRACARSRTASRTSHGCAVRPRRRTRASRGSACTRPTPRPCRSPSASAIASACSTKVASCSARTTDSAQDGFARVESEPSQRAVCPMAAVAGSLEDGLDARREVDLLRGDRDRDQEQQGNTQ